jgi:Resolvase, N terminal domain
MRYFLFVALAILCSGCETVIPEPKTSDAQQLTAVAPAQEEMRDGYQLEWPPLLWLERKRGSTGHGGPFMKAASVKPVRCAIYTRVSTDHGLDQEFNSLDAQYDAASAYIKSQAHAGWALIRSRYDDGGYSGGSTDRPDLQRLLRRTSLRSPRALSSSAIVSGCDGMTGGATDPASKSPKPGSRTSTTARRPESYSASQPGGMAPRSHRPARDIIPPLGERGR